MQKCQVRAGQCKPPFLPPPIVPVTNRHYVAGEVDPYDGRRKSDKSHETTRPRGHYMM